MTMKRFFVAGLTAAAVLAAIGCGDTTKETEPIIRPVRFQKVESSSGKRLRTFSGVSKAQTETNLSFQVGGIVQTIDVREGQPIKKGDRIATLDTIDMTLKLEELRASMANARVQQETARSNLNRVRELYENNNIALSEYEAAKNQYASARATYQSKQKQLDLQKRQLSYGVLTAPTDGHVAEVPVEKNENASAGQLVASIISGSRMEVEVGMPGTLIHHIQQGIQASVRFAHDDKTYTGTVTRVSQVTSAASTYPVSVLLDEESDKLRPGMPAEVSFAFGDRGGAENGKILVPASAVAEDSQGRFVYLLEMGPEDGLATAHRHPVVVGELTGAGLEILDGLEDGQFIVISGISMITDQMKVRVSQ